MTPDDPIALDLYTWNSLVSAVFLPPLQICEIAIRNAVSQALTLTHGRRWPWDHNFISGLPDRGKFKAKSEVQKVTNKKYIKNTGQLVAEMKLAFWENMLTSRHDERVWNHHLVSVMPGYSFANDSSKIAMARDEIRGKLERMRKFRNRIAHHEPIFNRALEDDYRLVMDLIGFCSPATRRWAETNHGEQVRKVLRARPDVCPIAR
ncbi:hypothetical protein [Carnimonas bestiolae]|uniref:hypothetical protein n=1 Tax=Carnimonas bestiolae TaxID=3402172 RepID=UPI003F4AF03E